MAIAEPNLPSLTNALVNLLPYSSFDSTGWTAGANCTVSFDTSIKKYGNCSLKVTSTSSSLTECYFYSTTLPYQIKGHIYYCRCEMYQTVAGVSSGMQSYWPEAEPSMGTSSYDSSKAGTWQVQSFRIVRNNWSSGNLRFRFDVENIQSPNYVYVDGAMLIDLTAAYGSGNEPSQSWCDENIPYFNGTHIANQLTIGSKIDFCYTGDSQSIQLPAGYYKFECWGAQGGNGYSSSASRTASFGGYSTGAIHITSPTRIYIYVGGRGTSYSKNSPGGFNGGGACYSSYNRPMNSGGGGTDIRIGQDSLYARVIVAGGGGGCSETSSANNYSSGGGGETGIQGTYNTATTNAGDRFGGGGGQTSGGVSRTSNSWDSAYRTTHLVGKFGIGGGSNGVAMQYINGGGGGWYGGGAGGPDGGAGGGSGYVYTSSTSNNYPDGCLLSDMHYLQQTQLLAGNVAFSSPYGVTETGHVGDGYARITVIPRISILDIDSIPNGAKIESGDIINISYSGNSKSILLPKGKYKFEV